MSRIFMGSDLEGVATFWRIERRDGVALGFTAHDRDLWLDGLRLRAAPGMVPSAIRRNASLSDDSAEVEGALSHDAISAADLAAGRYDGARIAVGALDWETGDSVTLYHGELGAISQDSLGFSAELRSAKSLLEMDPVPRTSPTCRARFCGPGCTLNPALFTHEATIGAVDLATNSLTLAGGPAPADLLDGQIRLLDGPQAGLVLEVAGLDGSAVVIEQALDPDIATGTRALLREGCDHTLDTCQGRFANSVNFQGEPYLPGNDLLARYPVAAP